VGYQARALTGPSCCVTCSACTSNAIIASPNEVQLKGVASRIRSQLPALINTKVQDICEPIEVDSEIDNIRRKRSMSTLTPPPLIRKKEMKKSSPNVSLREIPLLPLS